MIVELSHRIREHRLVDFSRKAGRLISGILLHYSDLRPLFKAPPSSALTRLLKARPEILGMVVTPYLCAKWTATERFARIIDHCETVERIAPLLNLPVNTFVDLLILHEMNSTYRLVLDQPQWFLRDGQATFSLWEGEDRLISLSYCLSSSGGDLTAYVGGLQGRSEDGVLERYRRFTKHAEGMRPTDFTIEMFRSFCRGIGVSQILAVSEATQNRRSAYFCRSVEQIPAHLNYDELWLGRGGQMQSDGFFKMSLSQSRRATDSIPTKKRAMYRRRYAMLDAMTVRLDEITRGGCAPAHIGHYMTAVDVQTFNKAQRSDCTVDTYSARQQSVCG
ncbi:hypothetical protein C0214_05785 [Methylobacterium sp. DM1]|nr:hypothetical protein C0214_05785 [Methylobacterium sp. DM1]